MTDGLSPAVAAKLHHALWGKQLAVTRLTSCFESETEAGHSWTELLLILHTESHMSRLVLLPLLLCTAAANRQRPAACCCSTGPISRNVWGLEHA
jgi:hypothetical protein